MIELKQYNCLCIGYGSYISVAERLGREDGFGNVFYWLPYVYNGYPDHKSIDIGRGVPNVIRVKEWAEVINDVQIVFFEDAHEPALMEYFVSIGKKVFGARYATYLEHDRKKLKELITSLGLPVNKYEMANGITQLDTLLKEKTNVYIKSSLRGDMESWHHDTYALSKGEIVRLKNSLGAYSEKAEFIIEEPIEGIAEIGIDTYTADGEYLRESTTGIEIKDVGYIGVIMQYKKLPKQLRVITDRISQTFNELNFRGAYSNEVIIGNDMKGYLLDNTNRCPQPNTDLVLEMYNNYPEIIWKIANGIIPEIKYTYKFGVQFIIKSDLAKTEPSPVIIPDEYKRYVKIKNLTIDDDGTYYYTPLEVAMCEIGSVIGMGNTMKEAIKMATKIAESIKGFDIKINTDCIDKATEQIKRLAAAGINYLAD